jgi:hypothetical protein
LVIGVAYLVSLGLNYIKITNIYISGNTLDITNGISCGSLYADGNVSAASFTDRTPFFEGDAISAVRNIKGIDGELDHSTLPDFVVVDEQYRDVGAMVSVLTVAVQQLISIVEEQKQLIDELRKG